MSVPSSNCFIESQDHRRVVPHVATGCDASGNVQQAVGAGRDMHVHIPEPRQQSLSGRVDDRRASGRRHLGIVRHAFDLVATNDHRHVRSHRRRGRIEHRRVLEHEHGRVVRESLRHAGHADGLGRVLRGDHRR